MNIRKYTPWFHDGDLIEIRHNPIDSIILFTMSSAQIIGWEEFDNQIELSKNMTIDGVLHVEKVAKILINDKPFTGILQKPYPEGLILDFEMIDDYNIELGISWSTLDKRGLDFTDLVKKLAADNLYNYVILNIIKTNLQHKYIILTRLAEHANNLCSWLRAMGISADTLVGSKNNYNDSKVLIGTIGKISTGFDEATACPNFEGIKSNFLIIAPSVKEYQLFEQSRGRVMRSSNPIVVWISPKNKVINNHFYGLKSWISETNGEIITQKFIDNQIII